MLQNGRHVGGDVVAVLPVAQQQRGVLPGGDEGVGVVRADDAQGVGPLQPPQAAAHGLQHIAALIVVELQKLGHHLGVGVRGEGGALLEQVILDLLVIFNDAVVHQGDGPVFADVGMGVDVVGLAVGGPAGVADAQTPLQVRAAVDQVGEHFETALTLFHLQSPAFGAHGDAGRVVAPVLHPLQSVQQNGGRRLPAHESDDSTHKKHPPDKV